MWLGLFSIILPDKQMDIRPGSKPGLTHCGCNHVVFRGCDIPPWGDFLPLSIPTAAAQAASGEAGASISNFIILHFLFLDATLLILGTGR